jgi:hypothetical protein
MFLKVFKLVPIRTARLIGSLPIGTIASVKFSYRRNQLLNWPDLKSACVVILHMGIAFLG